MARFCGALDFWRGGDDGTGRQSVRMLVPDEARQSMAAYLSFWALLLSILVAVILVRSAGLL
jgi:hypothetical protein